MDDDGLAVADVLDRAADLLTPEGAWTQGYSARDANGSPVFVDDKSAVCFCMWGAIAKVTGDLSAQDRRPIRAITKPLGWAATPDNLGRFNDTPGRTQAEVVAKLREAAALDRARARSVQS
jgi:hypothetical protein